MALTGPEQVLRPRFLYRYRHLAIGTDWNRLRQILVGSEMFAASRTSLNDPLDCQVRLEVRCTFEQFQQARWASYRDAYRHLPEGEVRAAFIKVYESLQTDGEGESAAARFQEVIDKFGIVCFSRAPDLQNQWEEYASHGTGVCLVFETSRDLLFFDKAKPVDYVEPLPIALAFADSPACQVRKCLYTKRLRYRAEEEYRALFPSEAGRHIRFRPSSLVRAYAGPRMTSEARSRLAKLVKESGRSPELFLADCGASLERRAGEGGIDPVS